MRGSGGSSEFLLSGTLQSTASSGNSADRTVVGTLENGSVSFAGTFIVQPISADGSLPANVIAVGDGEVVSYVPGTLRAVLTSDELEPGNGFASTAAAAAMNESHESFAAMPAVYIYGEAAGPPSAAVDTLGNPGFDAAVVCVKGHCDVVAGGSDGRRVPTLMSR